MGTGVRNDEQPGDLERQREGAGADVTISLFKTKHLPIFCPKEMLLF